MKGTCVGLAALILVSLATCALGEDDPALIEAGKAAVKGLKPLPVGEKEASYFEVKFGPGQAVGYVIASLEATRDKDKTVYRYVMETNIALLSGPRIAAFVDAKLQPDFEPIEIEMKRRMFNDRGEEKVFVERVVIGPDNVKLSAEAGGETTTSEVKRPDRPFLYGIETMVQRLDHGKHKRFLVRELDLQTGNAGSLTLTAETWTDGTSTVVARDASGNTTYQFWYDKKGSLLRWGAPSLPLLYVRTTKQRAEQLKATMGEVEEAEGQVEETQPATPSSPPGD